MPRSEPQTIMIRTSHDLGALHVIDDHSASVMGNLLCLALHKVVDRILQLVGTMLVLPLLTTLS